MKLEDFAERGQSEINDGLPSAETSDKEATNKILALAPDGWIKRIPFFVRKHSTTKTVERTANQYPELYIVTKREGELPEKERGEL